MQLLPDSFHVLNNEKLFDKAKSNFTSLDGKNDSNIISKIPLIHTTTSQRALMILESGGVIPYKELKKNNSISVHNNLENNTGELDKILGFEKYGFFSHGRIIHPDYGKTDNMVYLCFDTNKVGNIPGTIIAEKEIAELGAIVSNEAAKYYIDNEGLTLDDIKKRNQMATEKFYNQIMIWKAFEKHFPNFLAKHNNALLEFLFNMKYPGEKEILGKQGELKNFWQGYQFMIPQKVSINNLTGIICGDNTDFKKIKKTVGRKGVRVLRESEISKNTFEVIGDNISNPMIMNLYLYLIHNNKIKSKKIGEAIDFIGNYK